jgi:hypothetical protein
MIISNVLAIKCRPKFEVKLKMCMIKVCPHCGAKNDLSWADAGPGIAVIPLCVNCEEPLWPTRGAFLALGVEHPGIRIFTDTPKKKGLKHMNVKTLCELCDFIWGR